MYTPVYRRVRMYGKAFAPEYQGALTTPVRELLAGRRTGRGTERLRGGRAGRTPRRAGAPRARRRRAHRRLGHVQDADRAWKASYRAARDAGDTAAMAWALGAGARWPAARGVPASPGGCWSSRPEPGERGRGRGGPRLLAGRPRRDRPDQGDYAAVGRLRNEQLLRPANGARPGTVWARRHRPCTATPGTTAGRTPCSQAAEITERAGDRRGHALGAARTADVLSVPTARPSGRWGCWPRRRRPAGR